MRLLMLPLLACALVPLPVSAQRVTLRAGNWELLRDAGRCGARLSAADGPTLTVWQKDGDTQSIRLAVRAVAGKAGEKQMLEINVQRLPSAAGGPLAMYRNQAIVDGSGWSLRPDAKLEAGLWNGLEISISRRGRGDAEIARFTPGSSATWRELQRCATETARIDPGSGKPAATLGRPLGNMNQLIASDDYPPVALRNGWTGRSIVTLTVSAKGLVSGCETATSAGHAILDQAACLALSRRARFSPALDADGKPTQAQYQAPVSWTLP
jgi:TonB family protein